MQHSQEQTMTMAAMAQDQETRSRRRKERRGQITAIALVRFRVVVVVVVSCFFALLFVFLPRVFDYFPGRDLSCTLVVSQSKFIRIIHRATPGCPFFIWP
jgi:hypothetical protein